MNAAGKEPIRQPGIRFQIDPLPSPVTETTDGYKRMRPWQEQCFAALKQSSRWIINAPMASGKTFEICALAADALSSSPDLRVVIAVPQTIIADGFREERIEFPDTSRVHWKMIQGHDLCRETPYSSTSRLLTFLRLPPNPALMSRVLLCTHSTLTRAFARDKNAFRQVLLVIDEAHHIKHGQDDGVSQAVENQMGRLVRYALQHGTDISLGLSTATFFRGDAATIVPDLSVFNRFNLPYDEFLATCRHLRSFSFDFIVESDYARAVDHLFQQRTGKTIIYIPPVNSRSSVGSKRRDTQAILAAIAGESTPVIEDADQTILRIRRGDRWIRVVDLVDPIRRDEKKRVIAADHGSGDGGSIDVIIALGLFKEGANWKWADREIVIGRRNSLTEIIQIIGRLFRDARGKSHVETHQILPFALDQADRPGVKKALNEYLKAILLSMLLENVIDPAVPEERHENDGERHSRVNYLKEAIPDEVEAAEVLERITMRLQAAIAAEPRLEHPEHLAKPFEAIVESVLRSYGISDSNGQIANQLWRLFARRTVTLRGVNVDHVNVDLLNENPVGFLLKYASTACGIKTFQELRTALRGHHRTFADAREYVRACRFHSVDEWREFCLSGRKPKDIPSAPYVVYRDCGWIGFADWLGTAPTTPPQVVRPFNSARKFVRSLALQSEKQWNEYCESGLKPDDIPRNPRSAYREFGWDGFADWLGSSTLAACKRAFYPYEEAEAIVHSLKIRSKREWVAFCKSGGRPEGIPAKPFYFYRGKGWAGYGKWLGTGNKRGRWRKEPFRQVDATLLPFLEAREFVRALKLNSLAEWRWYCQCGHKPKYIPEHPRLVYGDPEWRGFKDWLGLNVPQE